MPAPRSSAGRAAGPSRGLDGWPSPRWRPARLTAARGRPGAPRSRCAARHPPWRVREARTQAGDGAGRSRRSARPRVRRADPGGRAARRRSESRRPGRRSHPLSARRPARGDRSGRRLDDHRLFTSAQLDRDGSWAGIGRYRQPAHPRSPRTATRRAIVRPLGAEGRAMTRYRLAVQVASSDVDPVSSRSRPTPSGTPEDPPGQLTDPLRPPLATVALQRPKSGVQGCANGAALSGDDSLTMRWESERTPWSVGSTSSPSNVGPPQHPRMTMRRSSGSRKVPPTRTSGILRSPDPAGLLVGSPHTSASPVETYPPPSFQETRRDGPTWSTTAATRHDAWRSTEDSLEVIAPVSRTTQAIIPAAASVLVSTRQPFAV